MITWFARHQTAADLLMGAIIILGLTALPGLQRETLPEIQSDKVQVQVTYRGATPEEVEDAVCRRLDDAIEGVVDLEELRCEAREGIATATAVMREGADMTRFLDDVKSDVDAIDDFPEQVELPVVTELGRTEPVVVLAVTGPEDVLDLKAYAEDLRDRLLAATDVAEVAVGGFSDRHIRIEVPAWRLRQFGLSAGDIADAVDRQSLSQPAGRLEGGAEDLLLRFDDQRKRAEEFRDLVVVSGATGATIRLGDIAAITDRFDRAENKVLFNGRRAAMLEIEKTRDQDVLELLDQVRGFIAAERAAVPAGVELRLTQDRASIVQDRLDMLVRNGVQGLALVFAVLWLFFGLRYSFWVAMGLPVSFLGALFLLPALGVTINMISMVGLLIGVGLLMDDAIVIAENVAARLAAGDSPTDAAVEGTREVLPGILSSFATTLLVFGSLAFISGELGQILRILPIVLILVVSVSLLEAFLILPHHLAHSLARAQQERPARVRVAFERGFAGFRDGPFGRLLDRSGGPPLPHRRHRAAAVPAVHRRDRRRQTQVRRFPGHRRRRRGGPRAAAPGHAPAPHRGGGGPGRRRSGRGERGVPGPPAGCAGPGAGGDRGVRPEPGRLRDRRPRGARGGGPARRRDPGREARRGTQRLARRGR
jgi:HAE1 family hydrophobic/amphiphilic exporter-1